MKFKVKSINDPDIKKIRIKSLSDNLQIKKYTFPEVVYYGLQKRGNNAVIIPEEILHSAPICAELIATFKTKLLMIKIETKNHPYDLFIVPEKLFGKKTNGGFESFGSMYTQSKRLYSATDLSIDSWIQKFQKEIDKYSKKYAFRNPEGNLHFYNLINTNENLESVIQKTLERIRIPKNFPFGSISFSSPIALRNGKKADIFSCYLWPIYLPLGKLSATLEKARLVYEGSMNDDEIEWELTA